MVDLAFTKLTVYILVVPSSAVTVIFILLVFLGLYVPSPATVAFALSVAVAAIVTSVSSGSAVYVYVVTFGSNVLSRLPAGSDVTVSELNVASLFSL